MGSDTIFGYGGNDTRIGADGDEVRYRGPADDRYGFLRFFARECIDDQSGAEQIRLLPDIAPADVGLAGSSADRYAYLDNYRVWIRSEDQLVRTNSLDPIVFSNGTAGSLPGGRRMSGTASSDYAIQGTAYGDMILPLLGCDVVYAGAGNDIMVGGTGRDVLRDGIGGDPFRYRNGETGTSARRRFARSSQAARRSSRAASTTAPGSRARSRRRPRWA
jgi:Ca2+-binding RTX toxin-like protein